MAFNVLTISMLSALVGTEIFTGVGGLSIDFQDITRHDLFQEKIDYLCR